MSTRISSSTHTNAQTLLSQNGTIVHYLRVNMPDDLSASDRNNILRYFERQQYDRQVAAGWSMLNDAAIQSDSKIAHARQLVSDNGVTVSGRRVRCR